MRVHAQVTSCIRAVQGCQRSSECQRQHRATFESINRHTLCSPAPGPSERLNADAGGQDQRIHTLSGRTNGPGWIAFGSRPRLRALARYHSRTARRCRQAQFCSDVPNWIRARGEGQRADDNAVACLNSEGDQCGAAQRFLMTVSPHAASPHTPRTPVEGLVSGLLAFVPITAEWCRRAVCEEGGPEVDEILVRANCSNSESSRAGLDAIGVRARRRSQPCCSESERLIPRSATSPSLRSDPASARSPPLPPEVLV
jgi:hypothetical protein